jgi:glucose-1-phosphate adenylyltransferase
LKNNAGEDFGKHIIPYALRNAGTYAFLFSGYWRDVGTLAAYWQSNMDLLRPKSGLDFTDWNLNAHSPSRNRAFVSQYADIGKRAQIENSIIQDNCMIDGMVKNSVLSPGVRVRKNAVVCDSVVMAGAEIGENAILRRTIVDEKAEIGKNAAIGFGGFATSVLSSSSLATGGLTVIAREVKVPDRALIRQNVEIYQEDMARGIVRQLSK